MCNVLEYNLMHEFPTRHPSFYFEDGSICLLDRTRSYYFNVHKSFICRHSAPLRHLIDVNADNGSFIEGKPVLQMEDDHQDLLNLLTALYDGLSELKYDVNDFHIVSSLLRLSTKYQIEHVRRDILRGMAVAWPKTLAGWEFREADATDIQGNYRPRLVYPHPILVINLARQTNAPDLLPSAFYDLCRCSSSEIGSGCTITPAHGGPAEHHALSDLDLLQVFKGREHAARFLTTFVATQLENRPPSPNCMNTDASRRRICQATFEAITFEILRDVNGVLFHRASDPLFAIMDADLMQSTHRASATATVGSPGSAPLSTGILGGLQRACEPCRTDFSNAVDATREEMWHRLPHWFGIKEYLDWP